MDGNQQRLKFVGGPKHGDVLMRKRTDTVWPPRKFEVPSSTTGTYYLRGATLEWRSTPKGAKQ